MGLPRRGKRQGWCCEALRAPAPLSVCSSGTAEGPSPRLFSSLSISAYIGRLCGVAAHLNPVRLIRGRGHLTSEGLATRL